MRTLRLSWMLCLLALALAGCKREAPPPPATVPASQPATAPAAKPPTTQYVEVLRDHYPKLPATQPLEIPVDLPDAGHWVITEPVYLDPRGDLWITRADAPPLADVLKSAEKEQIHIVRERVRYALWGADEEGKTLVRLAVEQPAGALAWIDGEKIVPLKQTGYRWDRAVLVGDAIVVPTARGASAFTFSPELVENYQEFVAADGANPAVVLIAPRGVIAWSPWDANKPGSETAWRFVDGKWSTLADDASWKAKFVHLVPLLDGSVLQIARGDDAGKLKLAMATLDASNIDEAAVQRLVDQLSDDDPDKRKAAFAELTRYGPASWPILEKLNENQPPEARLRIEQLLRNRAEPTLGGRQLVDGAAIVASRFDDGGVLLFAQAGVSIPRDDKPAEIIKPAWISIRPGRAIELLEPVVVRDATPEKQRFFAFENEWIVSDATQGPRRLFGNHLEPMGAKEEAAFGHVVGYDRRGRWLMRKSADAGETLIIDPTVPDPSPKLPVWLVHIEKGEAGWTTKTDWPAIKRGGAWALGESTWRPIDEKKESLEAGRPNHAALGAPDGRPIHRRPATTRSTTRSTTTQASTQEAFGDPILVGRDGRRWFDGKQRMIVIDSAGKRVEWTLPGNAASASARPAVLIETADGLLFLFNEQGRVVRIKPAPDGAEPFEVEAVFTTGIPSSNDVRRIWLDPAGRLVIAYEGNRLAILFPGGRIPQAISTLMIGG